MDSSSYIVNAAIEKLQSLNVACSINPLVPYAFREYFNVTVPHLIVELETEAARIDDGKPLLHPLTFEHKLEALTLIAEWSSSSSVQALLNLCAQEGLTELAQVCYLLMQLDLQTPFNIACANGHSQIVQLLMSVPHQDIQNGFIVAIENNHANVVEHLIPFVPNFLRGQYSFGGTVQIEYVHLLTINSEAKREAEIEAEREAERSDALIVQNGIITANRARAQENNDVLRFIHAMFEHVDICKMLVSNAELNIEYIGVLTKLSYLHNKPDMMHQIIQSAHNFYLPNIADRFSTSILEDACRKQNEAMVKILVEDLHRLSSTRFIDEFCSSFILSCGQNETISRLLIDNMPELTIQDITQCINFIDKHCSSTINLFLTHFIDLATTEKRQLLMLRWRFCGV